MPKFELKTDIIFNAKNVDDAALRISEHFKNLFIENYGKDLKFTGSINLRKRESKNEN